MNKKNDMREIDGIVPPKKSIRNISLPKKESEFGENLSVSQGSSVTQRADPAVKPAKRTKHLLIENEDDSQVSAKSADVAMPVSADMEEDFAKPIVMSSSPRNRKNWPGNVEEAFLSSDDIAAERKIEKRAGRTVRKDADDFGNTSSESHFQPLKTGQKRRRKGKGGAILFVIVALLVIFGLMHTVFARVSITLPTGKMSVSLADDQLATEIGSSVIAKNTEKKIAIDSIKTVAVSKKATGTVILYNNYSAEPYELIATTRLQTANGSVYKLQDGVKIPGKKGSTPGTISAKVEADLPGSEYNAKGGIDLKLPGLIAGTQKYVNIYAKTASNFTGGSKGAAPDLAASGLKDAIKAAEDAASADALAEAKGQHPELVFLSDSVYVVSSYDSTKIPAVPSGGGNIEVPVKFTTKVIGLKRDEVKRELETYLAAKRGQPISISPEALDFLQYKVTETTEESLIGGNYSIVVSGTVEGSFGAEMQSALKNQLAGKKMSEAVEIIDKTFGTENVTVKAWPFWKTTVPTNPNKIKIVIKNS